MACRLIPSSLHSKLASVTSSLIARGEERRVRRVEKRVFYVSIQDLPSRSFLRVPASDSFASSILRETRIKGRGWDGKNKEQIT